MSTVIAKFQTVPVIVASRGTSTSGWTDLEVVAGVGAEIISSTYLKINQAGTYRVTYLYPEDTSFDRQKRWEQIREPIVITGGSFTEILDVPEDPYQHIRTVGALPGLRIILELLT